MAVVLADDLTLKYPEKKIENLIVNKLYNESSTGINDSKMFEMSKAFTCNNSRKCRVEIRSHRWDEADQKKSTIKIEGCDCCPNDDMPDESSHVLFVENRAYDVMTPTKIDTKLIEANPERMQATENEMVAKSTKSRKLESTDLLNFAKQIATGMVNLILNRKFIFELKMISSHTGVSSQQ